MTNLAAFGFDNKTSSFYTRNHCDLKGYTGYSFRRHRVRAVSRTPTSGS